MSYIGTPIDTTNQFQSLVGKRFSGNASTTAFTLDVAPSSTLDIEVFVENVRQDPNSAYSLSGTTLTFAAAPPSGTNNIYVVHQAKAVGTISPAAGTVNADSFDNTVISGHTALAATPADTDEFLVSDAGTIKRVVYSLVKDGITVADQFRLSSGLSISSTGFTELTANLERVDTDGFGQLGTGVTESSGIFSFPSTGIYLIRFSGGFERTSSSTRYVGMQLLTTTDNSSYDVAAQMYEQLRDATATNASVSNEFIFDVTNTTTHKVKFRVDSSDANTLDVKGNSSYNWTCFTFIRLGDT